MPMLENVYKANDTEYLQRPLIENVVYTIEDDYVQIRSPGTIFITARRFDPVDRDGLLSLYKEVYRMAKTQGVKISYKSNISKRITLQWDEYERSCSAVQKVFNCIMEQARVVRERGIHYGCVDDTELDKLGILRKRYDEYFWRDSVISLIAGMQHDLQELKNDFSVTDVTVVQICL